MTRTDISWLIYKTEVELMSDVLGTGVEWPTIMGIRDADALATLRGLRRRIRQATQGDPSKNDLSRMSARQGATRRFIEFYPTPRITRIFPDDPPKQLHLDPVEQRIIGGALGDFWAERSMSAAALMVLFGDQERSDTLNWTRAVRSMIGPQMALSPAHWLRVQVCTELAFGSTLVGIPDRWEEEILPGSLTLPALRGLQRRIIEVRPGLRFIS